MRYFNTAGPNKANLHYVLPPLDRWNLSEIDSLVFQQKYFVLHAPRQTGKTSCMLALMDHLNQSGDYYCLYINVEAGQAYRQDVDAAMHCILDELVRNAALYLDDPWPQTYLDESKRVNLTGMLMAWCKRLDKPLVLLIDEIDALVGDTLIAVLRQLRSGYAHRPVAFPQTVLLCGVRDVRDYRLRLGDGKEVITGGSAFNIKAESLRLGNFSDTDIANLMQLHTDYTGQAFTAEAVQRVCYYTNGQPWLVNALCYQACFAVVENRDRSKTIGEHDIDAAKEALILRRDTHLDQLIDKLREPRVHRIISNILEGEILGQQFQDDDIQYGIDLGLIHRASNGAISIANPIYREVIPRELTWTIQSALCPEEQVWYLHEDGRLNMVKLLQSFQQFFRENSEAWLERFQYKEAGPQLLMQAFLQRIINGGGRIDREYGLGRRRTDLLLHWQQQRIVIELKILYQGLDTTIAKGVEQTADYMDKAAATEGHLVIFDRSENRPWSEKVWQRETECRQQKIMLWGM